MAIRRSFLLDGVRSEPKFADRFLLSRCLGSSGIGRLFRYELEAFAWLETRTCSLLKLSDRMLVLELLPTCRDCIISHDISHDDRMEVFGKMCDARG
jgi:hypothetical protein